MALATPDWVMAHSPANIQMIFMGRVVEIAKAQWAKEKAGKVL